MSPAELADISVTIATGTAKPVYRSAAVTTVITAEQITSMGATDLHKEPAIAAYPGSMPIPGQSFYVELAVQF